MTSSYSRPAGHRNNSISFPTSSVTSFRGGARCFFVTESAEGWIVSLRCRHIVTSEMFTGAVMPTLGRISTLPSTRGCVKSAPSVTTASLRRIMRITYQRRGYPRITNQEITIRWSGHSHECGHLQRALAGPPWAIASSNSHKYNRVSSNQGTVSRVRTTITSVEMQDQDVESRSSCFVVIWKLWI